MARIQVNQPLYVCYGGAGDIELQGIVRESSDEETHITLPDVPTLPGFFKENFPVSLKLIDQFGVHQGETKILRTVTKPSLGIVVTPPGQYQTKQDRKFYRIPQAIPLQISVLADSTKNNVRAVSEDISAGGIQFETELPLEIIDQVQVRFEMTLRGQKPEDVRLKSKIVRVKELSPERRLVAIEFLDVNERQREQMVRWVFDLQRVAPKRK